jgi:hypothetical protein
MKSFLTIACATAIAVTSIGATTAGASSLSFTRAMPINQAADANVIDVQFRGQRSQRDERRWHNRRGFYRQGQNSYYNGYRGHRERRAGYRQHNGMWFPLAAFAFGAIVGGAVSGGPVQAAPGRFGQAHVNWCASQYRSYRASDNTFQPYNGPRRQCASPYSR